MENLAQFKNNMDSITMNDIENLRAVQSDKTLNTHLERIKKGKFQKNEIGAITKLVGSIRFAKPERKETMEKFQNLTMKCVGYEYLWRTCQVDIMHFNKPAKITAEQSKFGKTWLKNHFFTTKGKVRSGKNTNNVGDRVLDISKSVLKFEFIGLAIVKNQFGDINSCLPIYRTYDRSGNYFDYAPIHWGQPLIMEGY